MKITDRKPIPKSRRGAFPKYPFEKMKPGQSFLIKASPEKNQKTLRSSILTTARNRGYKIQTGIEHGEIRVWLIEKVK
jgi:hypothetical protein